MIMAATSDFSDNPPNGPGAAALLAAAIGCAMLGVFAFLGDAFAGVADFFKFYVPTGPLSGVSTSGIAVWLAAWFSLGKSWADRQVDIDKVIVAAFTLLVFAFAFTFPPFMDLLQGK